MICQAFFPDFSEFMLARNSQGKAGAVRMRQMKKQQQVLRIKLKGDNVKGTSVLFPDFLGKFI